MQKRVFRRAWRRREVPPPLPASTQIVSQPSDPAEPTERKVAEEQDFWSNEGGLGGGAAPRGTWFRLPVGSTSLLRKLAMIASLVSSLRQGGRMPSRRVFGGTIGAAGLIVLSLFWQSQLADEMIIVTDELAAMPGGSIVLGHEDEDSNDANPFAVFPATTGRNDSSTGENSNAGPLLAPDIGQPAFVPTKVAAPDAATDASPSGLVWLTGTIEDISDEQPAYRSARADIWPHSRN
jgi:hypothetical protein